MVRLRLANWDRSTCVHELMHMLADKRTAQAWKKALGDVMEEAAAEYLCGMVCTDQRIPYQLEGYFNNVTLLETIMEMGGVTKEMLLDAYLNGNTQPVTDAIIRISGPNGLSALQENLDSYDAYHAWVAEYQKINP